MKKTLRLLSLVLFLIIIKSCIEPIEIDGLDNEDFLVVQATLTNELKNQTVKLSRTFPIDSTETIKETNAVITIKDNTNTYSFSETSDGIYTSDIQFKAEVNNNYILEIKTKKGVTYISNPEKISGLGSISEITPKKETNNLNEEGINIYLKGKGVDDNAKYFRYEYIETYQIKPPYWSGIKLEVVSDEYPFSVREISNDDNNRVCYKSVNSIDIIQAETVTLTDNTLDTKIKFLEKDNFGISHRYSISISQYVQSFEAYNYYRTLKKLVSNSGSFTQTQPGFLLGNITSTTNPNNKAIGYFEVASVTSKRIFFNRTDFFPRNQASFIDECEFIAPELTVVPRLGIAFARSPLINALQNGWIMYQLNPGNDPLLLGQYYLVKQVCGDCTVSGTNIKPNFWID